MNLTRNKLFRFEQTVNDETTLESLQLLPPFRHCTEEIPPKV